MVWLEGGPSHIDMYDLKPDAPAEIRGEFKPIRTNVPGMDICELLPLQAKIADKLAIVRNMTFQQQRPSAAGGTADRLPGRRPARRSARSSAGCRPTPASRRHAALRAARLAARPAGADELPRPTSARRTSRSSPARTWQALTLSRGHQSLERLAAIAATCSRTFDSVRRDLDAAPADIAGMDAFTAQALEMISSPTARDAFDVSREPERVRDAVRPGDAAPAGPAAGRGGRPGRVGQLHRRREGPQGGVRLRRRHLGHARQQLASAWAICCRSSTTPVHALVTDLHERGLDKDVAVVVWGEFGRAPRHHAQPGPHAGRDHWPQAGFALMLGGGLKMGQVIGATDAQRRPARSTQPYTPQNVLATLYHVLGIDPETTLPDPTGRPDATARRPPADRGTGV